MIVIADDRDVLVFVCERCDEFVLRVVDVLVFIDEHVAKLVLVARARFDVFFQQLDRATDQIVEIEAVGFTQTALVLAVDRGIAFADERRVRRFVLIGREQLVLRLGDFTECRIRSDLAFVVIEIVQNVANDRFLIGIIHDGEVRSDPDLLAVATQHAHADRMERADPQIFCNRADHLLEARFHFARRLVRERHGQNAIGKNLLLVEQVRDPVG